MRGKDLLDAMELTDPAYVTEAEVQPKKKKNKPWRQWSTAAACLALLCLGGFALLRGNRVNTPQSWNSRYEGKDYFRYNGGSDGIASSEMASLDPSAIPYAESRSFSDRRGELEDNGTIPRLDDHPLFSFSARYLEDGSLYCLELRWNRRGSREEYSDLTVVAGYTEVPRIEDCITVELDENGRVLEPQVTVTERDGVPIVARGREGTEISLTYETDAGWYQISGSWNDDYDSVAALCDWFWEHPLDLAAYPREAGDVTEVLSLAERPDAFRDVLPDFAAFGWIWESDYVMTKNGVPIRFEGHYVAHVPEELVKEQNYYDTAGYTTMHWCVFADPDVYDLKGNLGELDELTREAVLHHLEEVDNKVKFMQDGLLIIVYPDDAAEAWALIESLQNG